MGRFTKIFLGIVLFFGMPLSAMAEETGLICEPGEAKYVFDAGAAIADEETKTADKYIHQPSREFWDIGGKSVIRIAVDGLPSNIQRGKTLERYIVGDEAFLLGNFAVTWPLDGEGAIRNSIQVSSLKGHESNPWDLLTSSLFNKPSDIQTIDMKQTISVDSFSGSLNYFTPEKFDVIGVRIAVCSLTPVPKTEAGSKIVAKDSTIISNTGSENSTIMTLTQIGLMDTHSIGSDEIRGLTNNLADIKANWVLRRAELLNLTAQAQVLGQDIKVLDDKIAGVKDIPSDISQSLSDLTDDNQALNLTLDVDAIDVRISKVDQELLALNADQLAAGHLLSNPLELPDLRKVTDQIDTIFEAVNRNQLAISNINTSMAGIVSSKDGLVQLNAAREMFKISEARVDAFIDGPGISPWIWLLGGAGLIFIGGGILGLKRRHELGRKSKPRKGETEDKSRPKPLPKIFPLSALTPNMRAEKNLKGNSEPPPQAGLLFKDSPMVALYSEGQLKRPSLRDIAKPGFPEHHDIPKGLQDLTEDFDPLKIANQATGRIGKKQNGVPSNMDRSMGTGFLISSDLVMTNHHVYFRNEWDLVGDDIEYGIEFIAEKNNPESDFMPFDGNPPIIIPGLDVVIFRLKYSVRRAPIPRMSIPTMELKDRQIAVIGYPDPGDLDYLDEDTRDLILSLVEPNPIFSVKRVTLGDIFTHDEDDDESFGITWEVPDYISSSHKMDAICHRASTMGGNSGSPILDVKTGELLGVHFAGVPEINYEGRQNLALAIQWILDNEPPL